MGSIDDFAPVLKVALSHDGAATKKSASVDSVVGLQEKFPVAATSPVQLSMDASDSDTRIYDRLVAAMRETLECCGENLTREGLLKTPERAAQAMLFFTSGYVLMAWVNIGAL